MLKKFTEENVNLYEFVSNKNYVKNQTQVTRFAFISGSSDEVLSRNYNFARINLYLSGSEYSTSSKRYNSYPTAGNPLNKDKMLHISRVLCTLLELCVCITCIVNTYVL